MDRNGCITVLALSCFLLAFLWAILQPWFEAEAYNKHRSPNQPEATYWDAAVSDLRINTK
jgi:hypothetical protein